MTRTDISNDPPAPFWKRLPGPEADEDEWYEFKQQIYELFVQLIRHADREFAGEPYRRLEELRRLRREHNLLVIADRIRRETARSDGVAQDDLRKAAERVVDRSAHIGAAGEDHLEPRSRAEEKMLISARVNWHKLLRRAGARAELRGRWGGNTKSPGTKTAVAKIAKERPKMRARLLREYLRKRLEQLAAVSHEIEAKSDSRLSRQDKLLIRELDLLVTRARTASLQETGKHVRRTANGGARRLEPLFGAPTDGDGGFAPEQEQPSSASLS